MHTCMFHCIAVKWKTTTVLRNYVICLEQNVCNIDLILGSCANVKGHNYTGCEYSGKGKKKQPVLTGNGKVNDNCFRLFTRQYWDCDKVYISLTNSS